jgi:hypothetical protein
MTAEDLQKERNKRNAKKSRKKKKNYIDTLESKVAGLEEQLREANAEISRYKTKDHLYHTGDKSGYSELIKTQELFKKKGEEIVNNAADFPNHFLSFMSLK